MSLSRARFADVEAEHAFVPEAVNRVVSAGVAVDNLHRTFAALRLRYFGPRALVDDDSVRSKATTLLNAEGGYQFNKYLRLNLSMFNLANSKVSDIDYYFASRLRGEPVGGVEDIHTTCEQMAAKGGRVVRSPGPMKHGTTVIAFVEDPDGYKVELIQRAAGA